MASGGRRQGRQGKQYPNRSDMRTQPAQAAKNQAYGQAGSQLAAQHQIPLENSSAAPSSVGSSPAPPQAAPGGGVPQVIPSLSDPTTRPDEPLTAGLATGPGPNAMPSPPDPLVKAAAVLNNLGDKVDPVTAKLRAMVNAHLGNQGAA